MKRKTTLRHLLSLALIAAASPAFAYWTPVQVNLVDYIGLPPAATSVYGVRANVLYGNCEDVWLCDAGLFNYTTKGVYGFRAGFFNICDGDAWAITAGAFNVDNFDAGILAGAINFVKTGYGIQIGVINVSEHFAGLQIGLINILYQGPVPLCPIINVGTGR